MLRELQSRIRRLLQLLYFREPSWNTTASYELLPSSTTPINMLKTKNSRSGLILLMLVLSLLIVTGVSAGVIVRSSNHTGEYLR